MSVKVIISCVNSPQCFKSGTRDDYEVLKSFLKSQKPPSIGVLIKRCSENIQQIYRRTTMLKCDFNEVGCSHVNLLHIFRTPVPKNTYGGLLLKSRSLTIVIR